MSILQKLTLRHLRANRRRTWITVVGIALSVAMVTAVSGMIVSFQDLLYRESILQEGLWHVRYSGVSQNLAERIAGEPIFSEWEILPSEEGVVLSLQFRRLHKGIFEESEAVCEAYGVEADQVRYHNNLLIAKGIVPGSYYGALYTFAGILLVLIGVGSVLVISNAFAISSDQRGLQFGLLKSAGATAAQIRGMVFFEGFALATLSIPMGILGGILAQWVALSIANSILTPMIMVNLEEVFRVVVSPATLGAAVLAAYATVFLSAWLPARRAGKTSPVEAIRQTRSIRLTRRSVEVSSLTGRLFGFEGILAAKAMGRNRGKYRATILALVVSIVLFIGVSSFADILVKATSMVYVDMGSNLLLTLPGGTAERNGSILAELETWEGVELYPNRNLSGSVELPEKVLSREYLEHLPGGAPPLQLISIGEKAYRELLDSLRLSPEGEEAGSVRGILLNTSGTIIQQGRRISFTPYRVSPGERFPASAGGRDFQLVIAGSTPQLLPGAYPSFHASRFHVIVSEETMAGLWDGEEDILSIAVLAEDADGFEQRVEVLLEREDPQGTYMMTNFEKQVANSRNIATLVMIFVYGFIAMLTLIGITSVVTTISTSIALRTREFAMLRSVGMAEGAIAKMLRYESLLYGVKALLWGIPLGLAASVLLYLAMTSVMDFPYLWPLRSVLLSVAAVFLLTGATMAFARRKQRRANIAGALRDDVI